MKNLAIGSMSHLIDGLRILQAYHPEVDAYRGVLWVVCNEVFEADRDKLYLMDWKLYQSNSTKEIWQYDV